jgi:translation initiation factor 3 subunit I
MKPILMKGHERPLTFLRYNRDGDLLFSCAKDHTPTVWYADNGAVWTCDVSRDSARLITGFADQTAKLWEVSTGKELFSFRFNAPARSSTSPRTSTTRRRNLHSSSPASREGSTGPFGGR